MLLNAKEIKEKKLLRRAIHKNYFGASYNLTIGEIATMDGKKHDEYKIPPRGMLLIVSHELFNLPDNIIGYTTVKNALSINGIMAINIGIVDPEWDKPISSLIINFGNVEHLITKGDSFLRMTFHEFKAYDKDKLNKIENFTKESDDNDFNDYVKERRKQSINNLSSTFLSIIQIKNEIARKVRLNFIRDLAILAGGIAILGFVISFSQDFMEYRTQKKNNIITEKLDSLYKEVEILKNKSNFEENKKTKSYEERDSLGGNIKGSMESKRK